jgi:hypothetical protein
MKYLLAALALALTPAQAQAQWNGPVVHYQQPRVGVTIYYRQPAPRAYNRGYWGPIWLEYDGIYRCITRQGFTGVLWDRWNRPVNRWSYQGTPRIYFRCR